MFDGQHSAVAVADHDRVRETPFGEPAGGVAIVGNALVRQLKRGALGGAAIADAQDIVAAPVESEQAKPSRVNAGGRKRGAPT
jgi:hypothetical protein